MTYIGSLSGGYSAGGATASGITSPTYTPGSGLSGLASGINTDSMVNAMVQAAQVPLVQLLQQRQILHWQEMRYQQVNASLSDLQNSVQSLKLQSTFLTHQVTSSNNGVLTGSANTLAPNGTYNVTIIQLAQGATAYSASPLSVNASTQLSDIGYASPIVINGQSISLTGTETLGDALAAITSDTKTGVSAFFDPSTNRVVLQTTSTGAAAKIQVDTNGMQFLQNLGINQAPDVTTALSGTLSSNIAITINGVRIALNGATNPMPVSSTDPTVTTVVSTINQYKSQTGVTADVDSQGHLVLKASYTDSNNQTWDLVSPISVTTEDPGNVLGLNGVLPSDQTARDAVVQINGYQTTSSTNQVTYNGLTLNLNSVGSATLTVSTDVDSIVNTITNFVQQYNQTLQLMQGLYNEQRNYDYQPLTQQQASQMTEDQIEKWYQKAQSGMLANDPLLGNIMTTVENDAQQWQLTGQTPSTINGQSTTLDTLAKIGITPIDPLNGVSTGAIAPGVTTTGWNTYGLLQINTDQLRAAVQADPQAVMRMFTNNPSAGGDKTMGDGFAVQLSNDLTNLIQQLTSEAGSSPNINSQIITKFSNGSSVGGAGLLPYTPIDPNADFNTLFGTDALDISFLGQQIHDMDSRADDMQQRISDLRQRYLDEFSQMEQALTRLSSQTGFLSSLTASQGG
ncbi:flagellar filament capping protein FliD [Alicyclobacillus sp.]|uniref:flagellar filament capping protein FliD n=1 Tax=Alicyclobacillus sp. TaxID=61169 RepID=UPI0025BBEFF2|nr:flagellar filament capping protein FliD [Alicyclobacillus sp.]MCL6516747.1 flagellar filament capping protein FliD [Alicyclobacillus sp.]